MQPDITQNLSHPLKIAFFVEGMYASGVDTMTRQLARALRDLRQQVVIFSPWKAHYDTANDEDSVLLPAVRVNPGHSIYLSYPISFHVIAEFKRRKFDLVHIHTSTSVNLLAWQVAKLFHLPVVYTYHTLNKEYTHYYGPLPDIMPFVGSVVESFDKMVCNGADIVLTPSFKAADYLAQLEITPPITVIPNGVDLNRFSPQPADYLQTKFGVPADAKVLLFVGRLNLEKRPVLAYTLFRRLALRHSNLCLVMVGDGALRPQLEQMAQEDGLQQRLFLTGLVDYADMPQVYNSAHIWISTSISEVHPMVALEAVACGLPVVTWRDRALEGIIDDGVNGFIVESEDAFVDRVQQLLTDHGLYRSMQRAGQQKIQNFSIAASAQQTLQVYRRLVQQHVQLHHEDSMA